jgi:hypothetical protein
MNRIKKGANATAYFGQYDGADAIPATPVAMYLRHKVGESLQGTTESIKSEELLPGRATAEPVQGQSSSTGAFPFEFSSLSFDRLLSAVMMANWVQDATDTKIATLHSSTLAKKFWILKCFTESDYPMYQLFKKLMVDSLELTLAINAIASGSFSFLGVNDPLLETANPVSGLTTFPAALTTTPFTSRKGYLKIAGTACTYAKEVKTTVKNNLAAIYALFIAEAIETAEKKFDVTGTLTTYLPDEDYFNKAVNATSVTLGLEVEDAAGNKYTFEFSNVKLTTHPLAAGSVDELSVAYDFTAFGSDVLTITKTLAVAPTVYTLTYDDNDSTGGTVPAAVTKNEAGALLYASANSGSLVLTGKTFSGWNTAADGTGTDYAVGASVVVEAATTLFAKWV